MPYLRPLHSEIYPSFIYQVVDRNLKYGGSTIQLMLLYKVKDPHLIFKTSQDLFFMETDILKVCVLCDGSRSPWGDESR